MAKQRGPFCHPKASAPSFFLLSICILTLDPKGHNNTAQRQRPGFPHAQRALPLPEMIHKKADPVS